MSRARLYPGALTLLFPRVLLMIVTLLWTYISLKVLWFFSGCSCFTEYLPENFRPAWHFIMSTNSKFLRLSYGFSRELVVVDFDYSYYLGPDWKSPGHQSPTTVPTVVPNHVHPLDPVLYIDSPFRANFIAVELAKKVPFIGSIQYMFNGLYLKALCKESRNDAKTAIINRQKEIAEGKGPGKPLWIAPEGCTGNHSRITFFNRGAFISLLPC